MPGVFLLADELCASKGMSELARVCRAVESPGVPGGGSRDRGEKVDFGWILDTFGRFAVGAGAEVA